jgi:hypothetical protein
MGVSLLESNEFILNMDDISNVVDALEIDVAVERSLALCEKRDIDQSIQTTYSYMKDVENRMKRSDAKYARFSYCI